MKKILYVLTFFCLLLLLHVNVYASDSQATTSAQIKYDLAYPGILPDNPLYKLRVIRDKILETFITDPKSKADFYLLQTDKGISASAILIDKHETKLAEETALKAENNFTLLTQQLFRFPQKPDEKYFEKLETAALKHQEVLKSLMNRVSDKDKKTFEDVIYFSQKNLKTIEDYKTHF